MECKDYMRMVTPYIRNELTEEDTEDFLAHIRRCDKCREELEIYYTIEVGLKQLDSGKDDYNITGALENYIKVSYQKLHMIRINHILRYAMETLVIMSVVVTLALQMRIWILG